MPSGFEVYNLGADEYCSVKDSISWITNLMGLSPKLEFSGGNTGWVGDNPFIFLDTKKIRASGWNNTLTIRQSVERTATWLLENRWVLESS
jgi:UDP-glucose 4-epimerase